MNVGEGRKCQGYIVYLQPLEREHEAERRTQPAKYNRARNIGMDAAGDTRPSSGGRSSPLHTGVLSW